MVRPGHEQPDGRPAKASQDLAAVDASFGALRDDELDVDFHRADGQRGAYLRRISRL